VSGKIRGLWSEKEVPWDGELPFSLSNFEEALEFLFDTLIGVFILASYYA
jgi:hypothetical protein